MINPESTYTATREDLAEALHELNPDPNQVIAEQILPVKLVQLESDNIPAIRRENAGQIDVDHANGGAFNRTNFGVDSISYQCTDKGLEGQLTQRDRRNYENDFDAELETIFDTDRKMRLANEIVVKELIFNTTTWTGSALFTDNSGSPWDNIATKITDQVTDAIDKVRAGTGFKADSMVIGAGAMKNIKKNTEIKGMFPGAVKVTIPMIAAAVRDIFDLENLYVGNAVYNSANEGQAFVAGDIWPDDYAMVFKKNVGSTRSGGLGRTVVWASISPNEYGVEQYPEPQTDSEIYRVRLYSQAKIFDPAFGHLMQIDV